MKKMKAAKPLLALALILATTAAAPPLPQQFDYVCDATLTITAQVVGTRPPPRKITRRYSVDLSRNLWCWNENACKETVAPIEAVTDEAIVFADKPDLKFSIQRREGKLSFVVPGLQKTVGKCTMGSYTPIAAD